MTMTAFIISHCIIMTIFGAYLAQMTQFNCTHSPYPHSLKAWMKCSKVQLEQEEIGSP